MYLATYFQIIPLENTEEDCEEICRQKNYEVSKASFWVTLALNSHLFWFFKLLNGINISQSSFVVRIIVLSIKKFWFMPYIFHNITIYHNFFKAITYWARKCRFEKFSFQFSYFGNLTYIFETSVTAQSQKVKELIK